MLASPIHPFFNSSSRLPSFALPPQSNQAQPQDLDAHGSRTSLDLPRDPPSFGTCGSSQQQQQHTPEAMPHTRCDRGRQVAGYDMYMPDDDGSQGRLDQS